MSAPRYDAESRYERFAQLRAAHPDIDFNEIMLKIYDEEQEADEIAHYEMLNAQDAQRAEAQA